MGFWTNKNEGIWSEMIHHHWQYLFGVENKPHLKKPYKDLSLTILKFLVSMIIFGCCILKTLLVCQLVTRIHLRSRRLWTFMLSKIANLGGPPCTSGMIYIYDIYIWSYIYILLYIYVYTPKVLVHQLESIVCGPLAKQPTGAPRQDTVAQLHSCWRSGAARQGLPKTIEKKHNQCGKTTCQKHGYLMNNSNG